MKSKIKDQLIPFLTAEEINSLICDLAQQIDKDYASKELVVISTLKGSLHFTADLVRQIQKQVVIDFVHLRKDRDLGIQILKDVSTPLRGKHVLIVQQIIDKGSSLMFLQRKIETAQPASLKILTLLDKPSRREASLFAHYVGQTIDDRFLVGYGLDWQELGRNYPEIYQLKQ